MPPVDEENNEQKQPPSHKLRTAFFRLFQKGDILAQRFTSLGTYRFRFFLSTLSVNFIGFCVLSGSNPFYLFVPLYTFPIPEPDMRKEISLYAFSRQKKKLVPITKKMLPSETLSMRLRLLAALVSKPLGSPQDKGNLSYTHLESLPTLGHAIRCVWEPTKKKSIIDMSEKAVWLELRLFHKNSATEKKASWYLDIFFKAFAKSIFHLEPKIQSLEFWMDGKRKKLSGMKWDIGRVITKSSIK